MTNPFLRRATEFIRDDSTFLSIVSPEPLATFFGKHPKKDLLLDLPVRVIGSPGSGKTMIASLVEFRLVETLLRDQTSESNRALAAALTACGFTDGDVPAVAAVRLPMESEYREFWELPYDDAVKTKLLSSLIQARAILAVFRNLCADRRRTPSEITFVPREGAEAQLDQIGGCDASSVRSRAREVERAIYGIGNSLVPPMLDEIEAAAREPYQPFEAIQAIEIAWDGRPLRLRLLTILDDVHTLHPLQFEALFRVFARREMRVGRWMMMRLDALSPNAVFRSSEEALPGLKQDRDYLDIFMQTQGGRIGDRKQFRRMALDMADRYLRLVQPLRDRGVTQFSRLLPIEPPRLQSSKLDRLKRSVDRDQRALGIARGRRAKIESMVSMYADSTRSPDVDEEVRTEMVRILLHRYATRVAGQNLSLFDSEDPEPSMPLKASAGVADAARLHLHVEFDRPFHYGPDDLCDASNENAEIFLQLAGTLVARAETKVIRGLDPSLSPSQQQTDLANKATAMIEAWKFPFARKVRGLTDRLAEECLEVSKGDNARLGAGANAVAVPESEMADLLDGADESALILKFAIAYGAIIATRDYGQGGKSWCLMELSGPVCLRHGLTLKRGGFLERRVKDLAAILAEF